ncbi:MAG: hypothetical protein R3A78_14600 [Polyangiales bacterium]
MEEPEGRHRGALEVGGVGRARWLDGGSEFQDAHMDVAGTF